MKTVYVYFNNGSVEEFPEGTVSIESGTYAISCGNLMTLVPFQSVIKVEVHDLGEGA